ncbi:hypothetical protein PIB30_073309 [Stylosanthes scabra]|uniref:Uncharacterized protein n=1 Tax=Stylosanthes scabra TaxID=79078 RepID=A0ABU6ZN32_9FABA|nr:hypothetical protein [Stylosanthes scabra]
MSMHYMEGGGFYFVELAAESEEKIEAQEEDQHNQQTKIWEMELAENVKCNLSLKRKREEIRCMMIEDTAEQEKNEEDNTTKKMKTNDQTYMAEEAGHIMPYLQK